LKGTVNELSTNSKNRNVKNLCIGINEFQKGFQPIPNLVKDESGDLLADFHSILNRWKYHLCKVLNVHGVNDIRQTEIHIAELLALKLSAF